MTEVIVVTKPELGWDCIVAVFKADDVSRQSLLKVFPTDQYVVHFIQEVHKDTFDFEQPEDLEYYD